MTRHCALEGDASTGGWVAGTRSGLDAPSDARKHFVNLLHRCAIAATKPSTPDRIRLFTCATVPPFATQLPLSGARYPFRSADLCPVIATSGVSLFFPLHERPSGMLFVFHDRENCDCVWRCFFRRWKGTFSTAKL